MATVDFAVKIKNYVTESESRKHDINVTLTHRALGALCYIISFSTVLSSVFLSGLKNTCKYILKRSYGY